MEQPPVSDKPPVRLSKSLFLLDLFGTALVVLGALSLIGQPVLSLLAGPVAGWALIMLGVVAMLPFHLDLIRKARQLQQR